MQDNKLNLNNKFIILYDEDCYLCKMLAQIATYKLRNTNISCESWQKYKLSSEAQKTLSTEVLTKNADKLRLIGPQGLKEGKEVWLWLLDNYPDLKPLGWIAARLGLSNITASILHTSTNQIRKLFCWKCHYR